MAAGPPTLGGVLLGPWTPLNYGVSVCCPCSHVVGAGVCSSRGMSAFTWLAGWGLSSRTPCRQLHPPGSVNALLQRELTSRTTCALMSAIKCASPRQWTLVTAIVTAMEICQNQEWDLLNPAGYSLLINIGRDSHWPSQIYKNLSK